MRKINNTYFAALQIPVPGKDAQALCVEPILALDEVAVQLEKSAIDLRTLPSNLLTALLSGEHEIPSSFDELIEAAS